MMSFSPRPSASTTSAVTLAPTTRGAPILTFSPSATSRTSVNSTDLPGSTPSSFSTRRVSPCCTRYCLPPVAMTAYMDGTPGVDRGRILGVRVVKSRVFGALLGGQDLGDAGIDRGLEAHAHAIA